MWQKCWDLAHNPSTQRDGFARGRAAVTSAEDPAAPALLFAGGDAGEPP